MDCLKHDAGVLSFQNSHCENKERLSYCIDYLEKYNTFENCLVFNNYDEINENWIEITHDKDYL